MLNKEKDGQHRPTSDDSIPVLIKRTGDASFEAYFGQLFIDDLSFPTLKMLFPDLPDMAIDQEETRMWPA